MATFREHDPLGALMAREQMRLGECVLRFAAGEGAALSEARGILRALADAEEHVLVPALARVSLRPEAQRLLEDSRDERARQHAALETLSRRRALRLRKLAAIELCELVKHHAEQQRALVLPVLASQLPRPVHRAIVAAFMARYQAELEQGRPHRSTTESVDVARTG